MVDLARIKSELLCWGLQTNQVAERIYLLQHPTIHRRTGNAGLHLVLDDCLAVNVIYGEFFCEKSPYSLKESDGDYLLLKNKEIICRCEAINPPNWYGNHTRRGLMMADIMLVEGRDTLITGIWNNCCYYGDGIQCGFCAFGHNKGVEKKNVDDIADTVGAALRETPNIHINLTGGNTHTVDRGINYYEEYIKKIRSISRTVPIMLEVSPPKDAAIIDNAINWGVNGFSINIEIWDEEQRKKICPGKSKISRDDYFAAWNRSANILGKFKSSSVLIAGLQNYKSIEEGVVAMVQAGIKPTIIPFRPFKKSALSGEHPADPDELLDLSKFAARQLTAQKADLNKFVGCEHCGACSLEKDLLN